MRRIHCIIIHENYIYFGAYRADFSKKGETLIENWQTWKNPETVHPYFHVPASEIIVIVNPDRFTREKFEV